MNRALAASLSNNELARIVECNQDIPRVVVDELVVRFIRLVDNGTIEDGDETEYEIRMREEAESEAEELRDAIREAISVLESV